MKISWVPSPSTSASPGCRPHGVRVVELGDQAAVGVDGVDAVVPRAEDGVLAAVAVDVADGRRVEDGRDAVLAAGAEEAPASAVAVEDGDAALLLELEAAGAGDDLVGAVALEVGYGRARRHGGAGGRGPAGDAAAVLVVDVDLAVEAADDHVVVAVAVDVGDGGGAPVEPGPRDRRDESRSSVGEGRAGRRRGGDEEEGGGRQDCSDGGREASAEGGHGRSFCSGEAPCEDTGTLGDFERNAVRCQESIDAVRRQGYVDGMETDLGRMMAAIRERTEDRPLENLTAARGSPRISPAWPTP